MITNTTNVFLLVILGIVAIFGGMLSDADIISF